MKNKIMISLTGGLGNQLFQLAAAINQSPKEKILAEWGIGKPRLNSRSYPEITSFEISDRVILTERRFGSVFISKCNGYILRMGISPRSYEKFKIISFLITKVVAIINFSYFKEYRYIYTHHGIGYDEIVLPPSKILLIGYFQSFRWVSDYRVLSFMKSLRIRNPSAQLIEYISLAENEAPLVVHIRLGDYKSETSFGILDASYYEASIRTQMQQNAFNRIWVFSDEIELAKKFIPSEFQSKVRWIPEINNSASETLELMRHGCGYVIGNSTFSWWGAYLSYKESSPIIAPYPWFKGLKSPVDLIPANWIVFPANF